MVEIADTAEELRQVYRLRHQVFCIDQGVIPATNPNRIESDQYDGRSIHIMLRRRVDGFMVGTVRIIVPDQDDPSKPLPMQKLCSPALLAHIPSASLGEVSRFALAPERRFFGAPSDGLLRLGLLRGILHASLESGLTHWCAMMERRLLRLLDSTGVQFAPVGPMVEAYGLRQPSVASVKSSLAHMSEVRPEYFEYLRRPLDTPNVTPVPSRRTAEPVYLAA
jgi:N-acyl-L-homoserine lactone synthetase